ncbi:MAG: hypothetical protein GX596_09710, partial [Propionibacterium sp.]|nr:hypothetical protein [Propionibacterium sp.]
SLNVPLLTTDADIAIDTRGLAEAPEIGSVLRAAGFTPGPNPGHWVNARDVAVDLMVVPHQAGTAKATARAARLSPHDKRTARIARGLEPALVDHVEITLTALDSTDHRVSTVRVAGPAALLTAKAIKLAERLVQADNQPDRLKEKDALDAFRLLQAVETHVLAAGFASHHGDKHASAVTKEAIEVFRAHASSPDGRIARLAAAAAQGDPTIAPSFAALVTTLLAVL